MKRNDRRGLELLCMSIIGWRSLQSALLIGCDVRIGVGTLIVMECGAEWVVLVQELEWGQCSGGEGYFEHFQGDVLFCLLPWTSGKVLESVCVCIGSRCVPSSRTTVFYDTFFWVTCLLITVCHHRSLLLLTEINKSEVVGLCIQVFFEGV